MFRARVICCIAIAWSAGLVPLPARALDEPVRVEGGLLTGTPASAPGVRAFKGVPFAAPPVGDLRWRPPQPVIPWSGVRSAAEFGPAPAQSMDPTMAFVGVKMGPTSEDCLYLNVYTPAKSRSDHLPVMMWIYGGGFSNGNASIPFYDGTNLAQRGVVVVTINYRVGPFGFFAHPLLSKESGHGVSGNYGLLDQIAALRWIKRNIVAFGGDSGRVTVFGESAGAISVGSLMVSPLAKGLFQRAIAESGSPFIENQGLREKRYGREPAERAGERLARAMLGDDVRDSLAALRAKSADEILRGLSGSSSSVVETGLRFGPIVDGWAIPDDPAKIFAAGREQAVPLIVGTNADEGTLFTMRAPLSDVDQYAALVTSRFGKHAQEVLDLYPASGVAEIRAQAARLIGDWIFVSPARRFAADHSRVKPTFEYRYTYVAPRGQFASLGAFHGSEIPRVFGTLSALHLTDDEDGRRLTDTMMGAWVRFAKYGDPNGGGLTEWPRYDPNSDSYMEFGREIGVKTRLRRAQVDLLERIAADRLANQ